MASTSKIAATVMAAAIFAIVGMLFMTPVVDAVNDSTGTQAVDNESVTVTTGEYVELEGYDLVDGSTAVYAEDGTKTTEGTDYEVNQDSGEIKALEGSTLINDGDTVDVTYEYEATGTTTTLLAGFVPLMLVLLVFTVVARETMDIL